MKKNIRRAALVLASPFILFTLICILVYLPPIQRILVNTATRYAHEATGIEFSIGRISLSFPLDLVIHDALAVDGQDTVLWAEQLTAEVQLRPLLKSQVELDGLRLTQAQLNTGKLIDGMTLSGAVGELFISSHGVSLTPETATINQISLSDTRLAVCLTEPMQEDTTATEPVRWKIDLQKIDIRQTSLSLQIPADSLRMTLGIGNVSLREGKADLGQTAYSARKLQINGTSFTMDTGTRGPSEQGLDTDHIALTGIQVDLDSLLYSPEKIRATIRQFSLAERSGLSITSADGKLQADEQTLTVPHLTIQTDDSHIELNAQMDWDATDAERDGQLSARLLADIGPQDILHLLPAPLSPELLHTIPQGSFRLRAGIDGNLRQMRLTSLTMELPGAFRVEAEGSIDHPTDSIHRSALLNLGVRGENLHFMQPLLGGIVLPSGLNLQSTVSLKSSDIQTHLELCAGSSDTVRLNAGYKMDTESYHAQLDVPRLDLHQFMPSDSLGVLSASLEAEGKGTDFFSPHTEARLNAKVSRLEYGKQTFGGLTLEGNLHRQKTTADLLMENSIANVSAQIQAILSPRMIKADFTSILKNIDLKTLGIVQDSLTPSMKIRAKMQTDLAQRHSLHTSVTDITLATARNTFHTKDFHTGVQLTPDSLRSYINSGDLTLLFRSANNIDQLLQNITNVSEALTRQWDNGAINHQAIKQLLPQTSLRIFSGTDNPIANIMANSGIRYERFLAECTTSSLQGIGFNAYLYGLHTDSLRLDSITFKAHQDSSSLILDSRIQALASKRQEAFNIRLNGNMASTDARLQIEYLNGKGVQGVNLGLAGVLRKNDISIHVLPDNPTLVYRTFHANPDNYICLNRQGRIHANLRLTDENHTGLSLYSTPDSLMTQDLTLALNRIDIAEFRRIIPYMPPIGGSISAEAHYVQQEKEIQVAADLSIDQLAYDNQPLGDWNMNAVYLPLENGEHTIDGFIIRNGLEILNWNGAYQAAPDAYSPDRLKANMDLHHFPLEVANAFIPDRMAALTGDLDGAISIAGDSQQPVINGEISLDSVSVNIPQASLNLRFDNRPVKITDSHILFDRFSIFTRGKTPFTINGSVDVTDLAAPNINLAMNARNFELINAKRTKESLVHGRLNVDFSSRLKGTLDALTMRGNMNILGSSNFTYILKDSPLTVEDRLNETVTFVDFRDTTQVNTIQTPEFSLGGIDILMTLHIDEAVQARVDLNDNGSNYMLLEGGGDLSFQYNPDGSILLNGRYSLISGEMKYEMPIIPLKTFHITTGSYIEWTGDLMNPNMNIKATERVRASASNEDGSSRMVNFDVGVNLTNRLENLGFAFTLESPDDGAMQNELAGKSAEEKNKLAVTMLVTGIYMDGGSSGGKGFDTNSMLNSFLQSEINKITKGFDLKVGMETTENEGDGTSRTNYNFQFAKRFWNNRFQVIIGGKISNGNDAQQQEESFIDNISLEYRLDNSGTRYIKIFHDKNYESILDGEVIETGAGVVLRKKVSRLGELFIFKNRRKQRAQKKRTHQMPLDKQAAPLPTGSQSANDNKNHDKNNNN